MRSHSRSQSPLRWKRDRDGQRSRSPLAKKSRVDGNRHRSSIRDEDDTKPEHRRRGQSPRRERPRSPKHHRSRETLSPLASSHHKKHSHSPSRSKADATIELPFSSRLLSKHDLDTFRPLFAHYLNIQKQMKLSDMDEREIRGRWKSFIAKWNKGELAEGWYDPEMIARASDLADQAVPSRPSTKPHRDGELALDDDETEGDEEIGPALPGWERQGRGRRSGPGIPTRQDLDIQREMRAEDAAARIEELRQERKADRKAQKAQLEELVPRAEAGTRERMLEKRQAVNAKMKEFRERSPGMEVGESELMGGGDGLEDLKRAKAAEQSRKTEREVRREEIARARREELEERLKVGREKEERTMSMLKELAKERFG